MPPALRAGLVRPTAADGRPRNCVSQDDHVRREHLARYGERPQAASTGCHLTFELDIIAVVFATDVLSIL
ncbi:hypothetical protein EVAR_78708_1 [Eumeta japonica]|uniref:Uncharacterized protein n=1 Tax=Eumeta variegata TaxID=151549 RepID=A0A4C1T101_EUMVA|nr:hypothetical protein EVAR_78708_1 [Eumeta japonica]